MEGRRKNNKQKTPKEQKRRVRGMTWKDRVPELEREEDARKIERDNQLQKAIKFNHFVTGNENAELTKEARNIADLAEELETDLNGVFPALRTHAAKVQHRKRLDEEIKYAQRVLKPEIRQLEQLSECLEEHSIQLRKDALYNAQEAAEWDTEIPRLEAKAIEYEERAMNTFTPDITVKAIEEAYETINELSEELDAVNYTLESYKDMPPDLQLANLKIEEKRAELHKLEEKKINFLEQIGGLAE